MLLFKKKCGTHEYLILTKFRIDWVKIVDFLIKAYFWLSPVFYYPVSIIPTCKAIIISKNKVNLCIVKLLRP